MQFSTCIGDLVPVGLGKYIQVVALQCKMQKDGVAVKQQLRKMFTALMKNMSLRSNIGSLPEVNFPDLSEINLLG